MRTFFLFCTALGLFLSVSFPASAAVSGDEFAHGMKSTHAVVLIDVRNPETLRKGDKIRISGLGCHVNSDKFQHEEGFLHEGTVQWAGAMYPGGFSLIVKVEPCKADIPGWAVQDVFVLERIRENSFYATGFALDLRSLQMQPTGVHQSVAWRTRGEGPHPVVCKYLRFSGPFSVKGVDVLYSEEEFARLGGVCPAYAWE